MAVLTRNPSGHGADASTMCGLQLQHGRWQLASRTCATWSTSGLHTLAADHSPFDRGTWRGVRSLHTIMFCRALCVCSDGCPARCAGAACRRVNGYRTSIVALTKRRTNAASKCVTSCEIRVSAASLSLLQVPEVMRPQCIRDPAGDPDSELP